VLTPPSVPLRRRRALTAVSGVSALGLLIWGFTTFAWGPRHPPKSAARPAPPVQATPPPPAAVINQMPAPPPPPPEVPAVVPAPVRRAKAKAVARRDCDPPYAIDARGIRRIKPGCLAP